MHTVTGETVGLAPVARVRGALSHRMGDGVFVRVTRATGVERVLGHQHRTLAAMRRVARRAVEPGVRDVASIQAGLGPAGVVALEAERFLRSPEQARSAGMRCSHHLRPRRGGKARRRPCRGRPRGTPRRARLPGPWCGRGSRSSAARGSPCSGRSRRARGSRRGRVPRALTRGGRDRSHKKPVRQDSPGAPS